LNQAILNFATDNYLHHRQVGDGTCANLAEKAIEAVGGWLPPPPPDGNYTWGLKVGEFSHGHFTDGRFLIPGDILQFRDAHFVFNYSGMHYDLNYEHHTAIVRSVDGAIVQILEQHTITKKGEKPRLFVTPRTLNMSAMQNGFVRAYRVIPDFTRPTP
jgi:hypothetical protein